MKIALYVNLPPGGARRSAFGFARELAGRHTVDLYQLSTTSWEPLNLGRLVRNVYVFPFSPLRGWLDDRIRRGRLAPRSLTLFEPLQAVHRSIAGEIASRGYDVVLAHTDAMTQSPYLLRWLPPGLGAYYCHEVLRVIREQPVLKGHRQNLWQSGPLLGSLRVLEDRWVLDHLAREDQLSMAAAASVLVNSRYTAEQVMSAYQREATVCYPGVEIETFSPKGNGARLKEVISVGSPVWLKGHQLVVEAVARVPQPFRPRLRVITAPSQEASRLGGLARRLDVDMVQEASLSDAQLATRYANATATVCAAHAEPFGLTALESMASGTPVVAVREGGFQETVVDGETGLLVERSIDGLASAVGGLAQDPSLVERLGRNGRMMVEETWNWGRRGREMEAVLYGLTGRGAPAPSVSR